jgi:heme oxygenase (biliverdin-IX-beta and delta-forming)
MTTSSVKMAHDSPPTPRTLLLRLKSETRDVHESLERDLNLLRPDLTLERYRNLVELFYGFHQPWEHAVKPLLAEHLPDFAEARTKIPKLLEDLAYLGSQPAKLPICQALPDCRQWPNLLGGLYVTEGATLGGQVISRQLEQMLGLSARRGSAFFSSYGLQVGAMWRSFCGTLQEQTPVENEDLVVAAARETFVSMHQWLCG